MRCDKFSCFRINLLQSVTLKTNKKIIPFSRGGISTLAVFGIYYKTNWSGGADRKHRQAQCALLGGLWLSCCLGQETCELNVGSAQDLAAQTHSLTQSAGKMEALPGHTGLGPRRRRVTSNQIRCCCAERPEQGQGFSHGIYSKVGSVTSISRIVCI